MSLLGYILHHEDGNYRKMPSICKQPQSLFRDAYLCLFLPFSTGLRVQMKVEQSPGVLTLQEGRNSFLICNYSTSMTSMQWFQQNPDGRLIFLFYIASGMQQKGRLKSTINSKELHQRLPAWGLSHLLLCCGCTVLCRHLKPVHKTRVEDPTPWVGADAQCD